MNFTNSPLYRTNHPPKRLVASFANVFSNSPSSQSTICCPDTTPVLIADSTGNMLHRYSFVMSTSPPSGGTSGGQKRKPLETTKSVLNFHIKASVMRLSIGVSIT